MGIEAGYYDFGRFADELTCLDENCQNTSYSDYYSQKLIHAGLLFDSGANLGKRRVAFLGGVGYYRYIGRYEDVEDRHKDQDGDGVGVTLGLGVPIVRLTKKAMLDVSGRFHAAAFVVGDEPGSLSFLTLMVAVKAD